MKPTVLFLFTLNLYVASGSIYFQQIGHLNPSPSYGHVHFTIDTPIIMKQLRNVEEAIAYVRKAVHTYTHQSVQNRARNFLGKAHLDIGIMIEEFKDLQAIFNDTTSEKQRVKRFLGLLLAIGSITMSLFNQAEILHLQGEMSDVVTRQHHIIDILQEHEVAIHTLQHDVVSIRDNFLAVINIVEETNAITKIHEAELEIIMAMAELRRTLVCIQSGIPHLLMHRLPLCFLDTKQIHLSMKQLSGKAAKHNLEPVSQHISAFLQYETSFLLIKGLVHIYVHVPLFDRRLLLDMLKFNNAPTQISDNLTLQLTPMDTILAIGQNGVHVTVTQSELDRYPKYGQVYFSNSAITLNNHINATCLGTIYSQDYENIKNACPTKFSIINEAFINLAPNEFIFYTKAPQTIQVKCRSETKHIAVQHSEKLTMKDNCEIRSNEHTTRSGHSLNLDSGIQRWPFNWNASGLLFDLDAATHVHDLKLIHYPPTPARDLHHLMNNKPHSLLTWMTVIILIVACIVTLIFIYLAYRYCLIRKQTKQSNQANQEAGV